MGSLMLRIYFGHAMDDQHETAISARFDAVEALFRSSGMQIIHTWDGRPSSGAATDVVRQDLLLMQTCDLVLLDMTLPGRNYVGCVGEMVYAHLAGLPAIVNVGQTDNGDRLWLQAHSTRIVASWPHALEAARQIVRDLPRSEGRGGERWNDLLAWAPN